MPDRTEALDLPEFAIRPGSSGEETHPSSADQISPQAVSASLADCAGVVTCEAPEGLDAITRPEVELVVWQRSLPSRLEAWLERLDATLLPGLRLLVRPEDLLRAMEPLLDDCGLPEGEMRALLVRDVDRLVFAFARIARTDLVDVRLESVSGDSCWKFHRDCVEARLLTTYHGPATEWVRPRHAEAALRAQKGFKGPLEHLKAHDVAIFKGSCAGAGSGIVHRSPPIAGTGRRRLLLCLNEPSAASPAPWSKGSGPAVDFPAA